MLWMILQEAKMLLQIEDRLVNNMPSMAGSMQAAPLQHPSYQLPNQGLNQRSGHDQGTVNDAKSTWDYAESPQDSKDFLGRRKCGIRQSLNIDFDYNAPMAVTRRSKDYGERT